MSGKSKHRKDQVTDFNRYRSNKMPDRERNSFERNLQQDKFAEEALQGFEGIDPEQAEADLLKLKKSLKQRVSGKPVVTWYRIAASVAVLMILSSIFIILEKNKPEPQLSYSPVTKPSIEISRPLPIEKQAEIQARKPDSFTEKQPAEKAADIRQIPEQEGQKTVAEAAAKNEQVKELARDENREAVSVAEAVEPDPAKQEQLTSRSAMAKKSAQSSGVIRGKVISTEDNQPVPGVTINIKGTNKGTITDSGGNFSMGAEEVEGKTLVASFVGMLSKEFRAAGDSSIEIKLEPSSMALSEVVVVGYGVSGTETDEEATTTRFTPPRPVTGKAGFERYIQDNLKRPDDATAGQRVVVVIGFLVRKDGKADSIKVIRSPAESFSEEAIRLIKQGPAWKPAEENGKPVEDKVRVRIVFK